MKRLRKFNESESIKIDYDYIYNCFAELIDDNKAEIELVEVVLFWRTSYITIRLKTQPKEDPRITSQAKPIENKKSSIYNYITGHNSNNELLQDFQVGLNRLSEEYPDYEGEMAKSELYNLIHNSEELYSMLENDTQLEAWVQSKITKAADYIDSVTQYIKYKKPHAQPQISEKTEYYLRK